MPRSVTPVQIAEAFGHALDQDDFAKVRTLVDPECIYCIGEKQLVGPDAIASSYQKNMIEGRKTLDELLWGESGVEEVEANEFIIHFTDHIKHKGKSFIHRCQQRITIGDEGTIVQISHIDNQQETEKLKDFFRQVGLE